MVGAEIRRARKTAGLTQEQVAFRAKLDRGYISQLENDKKSPTIDVLLRICEALGTSAARLIGRIEKARRKGT